MIRSSRGSKPSNCPSSMQKKASFCGQKRILFQGIWHTQWHRPSPSCSYMACVWQGLGTKGRFIHSSQVQSNPGRQLPLYGGFVGLPLSLRQTDCSWDRWYPRHRFFPFKTHRLPRPLLPFWNLRLWPCFKIIFFSSSGIIFTIPPFRS